MTWSAPASAWARSPAAISAGVPDRPGERRRLGGGARPRGFRVAHGDPDRDRERRRIAPDPLAGIGQFAPDACQPLVRVPEPGEVPGVGVAGGQLQHPGLLGGHEDRQVGSRRRAQDDVADRHPLAVEVGPALADERRDDRERLLEPPDAVVERVAERVEFGLVPAAPDTQDEPSAADVIERGRHLGQQRGVAEGRAHDDRPELHPAGGLGDGRQDRPALVDPGRLAVEPVEQVVEHPDRVEPDPPPPRSRRPGSPRTTGRPPRRPLPRWAGRSRPASLSSSWRQG